MTIEELKAKTLEPPPDVDFINGGHWAILDLAPEILALVEACGHLHFDEDGWGGGDEIEQARDAFNAKLAAL